MQGRIKTSEGDDFVDRDIKVTVKMWQISNFEASHLTQQEIFVNFQIYTSKKEMYKWIENGAKRNSTELLELSNKIISKNSPYFLG